MSVSFRVPHTHVHTLIHKHTNDVTILNGYLHVTGRDPHWSHCGAGGKPLETRPLVLDDSASSNIAYMKK